MSTTLYVKELRDSIVEVLKSAQIPFVSNNIFPCRHNNAFPSEGLYVAVYTDSTNYERLAESHEIYEATTDVTIEVVAQGKVSARVGGQQVILSVEDQLDFITDFVIKALYQTPIPSNGPLSVDFKHELVLNGTSVTVNGEGEKDKGCQKVSLTCTYECEPPSYCGQTISDFETIGNTLSVQGNETMHWETELTHEA